MHARCILCTLAFFFCSLGTKQPADLEILNNEMIQEAEDEETEKIDAPNRPPSTTKTAKKSKHRTKLLASGSACAIGLMTAAAAFYHLQHAQKPSGVTRTTKTTRQFPRILFDKRNKNNCFIHALLQALAFIPEFKEVIQNNSSSDVCVSLKNLIDEMYNTDAANDNLLDSLLEHFNEEFVNKKWHMNPTGAGDDLACTLADIFNEINAPKIFESFYHAHKLTTPPYSELLDLYVSQKQLHNPDTCTFGKIIVLKGDGRPRYHIPEEDYQLSYTIKQKNYELVACVVQSKGGGHVWCYGRNPSDRPVQKATWYWYNDKQRIVGTKTSQNLEAELLNVPQDVSTRFQVPALLFYRLVDV